MSQSSQDIDSPAGAHYPAPTPQRLCAAKTLFQLSSIFCFQRGHAFETNRSRRHWTIQNGESSLDKKQNQARTKQSQDQTRRKSITFILIEGKSRRKWQLGARGSINSHAESEAASASSLDVSAVSKEINNGNKESQREQCYERATSKNEPGLFFIVGFFIVQNECLSFLFCGSKFLSFWWPRLKLVPPWTRAAALAPWFVVVVVVVFFLRDTSLFFRIAYSWPRLNRVRLERECNTIAFPAKLKFAFSEC